MSSRCTQRYEFSTNFAVYQVHYPQCMGTLANISGKEAVKAFTKAGWIAVGQVGSHLVMTKPGQPANLSIPQHRELKVGTLRALIRNSSMTVEEFIGFL